MDEVCIVTWCEDGDPGEQRARVFPTYKKAKAFADLKYIACLIHRINEALEVETEDHT